MRSIAALAPRADGMWIALPVIVALGLYAPLLPRLAQEWLQFPNLSHGFAIPGIAAYLIWAKRDRLAATRLEPSLWGLPVLIGGLTGLVVGTHGQESFIARLSLPPILLGLVLFLAGWKIVREVWIGIAYLLFMVPLPWGTLKLITYRSRLFDATITAHVVGWLGVPLHQDGVLLQLPSITLEVADECSSIPAIAALLSLGVAYASLIRRSLGTRFILILAALPLAIFANIIRLITTVGGVYYAGPVTLQTVYHQFTGTVNFLLTFLLLLSLDRALARYEQHR
jgi:exosortase